MMVMARSVCAHTPCPPAPGLGGDPGLVYTQIGERLAKLGRGRPGQRRECKGLGREGRAVGTHYTAVSTVSTAYVRGWNTRSVLERHVYAGAFSRGTCSPYYVLPHVVRSFLLKLLL